MMVMQPATSIRVREALSTATSANDIKKYFEKLANKDINRQDEYYEEMAQAIRVFLEQPSDSKATKKESSRLKGFQNELSLTPIGAAMQRGQWIREDIGKLTTRARNRDAAKTARLQNARTLKASGTLEMHAKAAKRRSRKKALTNYEKTLSVVPEGNNSKATRTRGRRFSMRASATAGQRSATTKRAAPAIASVAAAREAAAAAVGKYGRRSLKVTSDAALASSRASRAVAAAGRNKAVAAAAAARTKAVTASRASRAAAFKGGAAAGVALTTARSRAFGPGGKVYWPSLLACVAGMGAGFGAALVDDGEEARYVLQYAWLPLGAAFAAHVALGGGSLAAKLFVLVAASTAIFLGGLCVGHGAVEVWTRVMGAVLGVLCLLVLLFALRGALGPPRAMANGGKANNAPPVMRTGPPIGPPPNMGAVNNPTKVGGAFHATPLISPTPETKTKAEVMQKHPVTPQTLPQKKPPSPPPLLSQMAKHVPQYGVSAVTAKDFLALKPPLSSQTARFGNAYTGIR